MEFTAGGQRYKLRISHCDTFMMRTHEPNRTEEEEEEEVRNELSPWPPARPPADRLLREPQGRHVPNERATLAYMGPPAQSASNRSANLALPILAGRFATVSDDERNNTSANRFANLGLLSGGHMLEAMQQMQQAPDRMDELD